jgi:hypothetical protein
MFFYHWTPNKKLNKFTKKYIYAWDTIEKAKEWKKLKGETGKIIMFEATKGKKYCNYYLVLTKNII